MPSILRLPFILKMQQPAEPENLAGVPRGCGESGAWADWKGKPRVTPPEEPSSTCRMHIQNLAEIQLSHRSLWLVREILHRTTYTQS